MKRQRAEISSNVISHIKSAHPIEMWRSNKLGIKEKISRGNFPRLIFSCPVPSGLPHRSHCVPMNMNPSGQAFFKRLAVSKDSVFGRLPRVGHNLHLNRADPPLHYGQPSSASVCPPFPTRSYDLVGTPEIPFFRRALAR